MHPREDHLLEVLESRLLLSADGSLGIPGMPTSEAGVAAIVQEANEPGGRQAGAGAATHTAAWMDGLLPSGEDWAVPPEPVVLPGEAAQDEGVVSEEIRSDVNSSRPLIADSNQALQPHSS